MSATLQRKVQKLLSSKARFDTPEMLEATEGLSDFYSAGDNTRDNRRKLRSMLERRSVHIHHSLVTAFAPVQSQLTALNTSLSSLLTLCDSTLAHLTAVKQHNTMLVQQTEQHRREQQQLQSKRELASAFLSKFQLSASDVETIEAGEIGDDFFASLARIGQIREDCKQLLTSYHQRVALDILDSLAKRLETGYERLYRHVQSQCAQLLSLPAPRSAFVSALTLLRAMPVYYDHCMSEMAQAHRLALIQRFMAAMTRGEAGSRPMDMQAHDSVRYVGDILAWVHQQAASERDFIAQLMAMIAQQHQTFALTASAAASSPLPPLPPEERQKLETEQAAFLSATFEGLSRLLRTRVEQALTTQPMPETAFKLYQLLLFYAATISPLFPSSAGFRQSLASMADSARVNFFDIVRKQGERVAASPPSCPADLSPPQVLSEAAGQLTAILTITASSVVPASFSSSSSSSSSTSVELAPVLAALLDPLLAAIQSAASTLPADEQCVYSINCLQVVVTLLRRYETARGRYEIMSLMLEGELERLVGLQYDAVMQRCGMKDVVERMRAEEAKEAETASAEHVKRSTVAGLDEATVSGAVRSFYSQLFSIGSFLVPQADRILQSHLRRSCRENVALCISAAYREVYDMVRDERNGYTGRGSGWLQHEPQHIDLVLEVKGRGDAGRATPTVKQAVLATPTSERTAAASSPSSSSSASSTAQSALRF